jgi:fibronectin type 3 domain-containing protein
MSSSQINLAWNDVDGESSYKVQRSGDGGATWTTIATVGTNITTYQSTGLAATTTYYYRVVASNSGGDSAASDLASATTLTVPTPPSAPSGLVATAANAKQVNLTWQDTSLNENGFRIERSTNGGKNWSVIGSLGANSTTFVDGTVSARKTYMYRVRAFNDAGNSACSNAVKVTTPRAAPLPVLAPSNLAASPAGATKVGLTWVDNSDNESGFRVERSTNGGKSWSQIATVSSNVTSFVDTRVAKGKSYSYRVRGYGDAGNSPYTNVAQAISPSAAFQSLAGEPIRATILASGGAALQPAAVASSFADADWLARLTSGAAVG